jgi:GNAT superfamily N-acetyltransferase
MVEGDLIQLRARVVKPTQWPVFRRARGFSRFNTDPESQRAGFGFAYLETVFERISSHPWTLLLLQRYLALRTKNARAETLYPAADIPSSHRGTALRGKYRAQRAASFSLA